MLKRDIRHLSMCDSKCGIPEEGSVAGLRVVIKNCLEESGQQASTLRKHEENASIS